jgi:hypothetical protein
MSEAYFSKVLQGAVDDVVSSGKGGRNEGLNKAAFSIGRHAHLAPASIDDAIFSLHTAAKQVGLNDMEIKATIGSGFKRGGDNPKELENSDATPYIASEMDRLISRLAQKDLIMRDDETRADKIRKAKEAWERAVPITRENIDAVRPALLYLNSRSLRASTADGVAKFSPNVYDGPAIIFPALTPEGEVEGVQSVLLTPDGKKREVNGISKYSRGVIAGNVLRVGNEHEGGAILLCEGPEDALSLKQAVSGHAEATIVCTFGKAGMATYSPPRASDVTICADPDLDVEKCADVLRGDGSTAVYVVRFDALGVENVKDANDFLREAGEAKLREALAGAKPYAVVVQEQIESERQWPTAYTPIDPALIPKRRWIYDNAYIRSYISVLASAGGVGKTSMQIVEALAIASGRPLLGETVHERTSVWMVNLEDPLEEAQRRIAAAMKHYNVKPEDIEGRFYVDAGREVQIKFATQTREGVLANDELVEYMSQKISQHNIGMVFIDPWVGANDINENDNVAMNAAVAAARWVCDKTDCAMVLTHHIRKGNGEDANIDSVRGAGSLIGAARAARVINKVSQEDAMKLGLGELEALGIFRVDDGKANLSPPAAKAVYRRMEGVELPNGEWVGVAIPFKMPDLFDNVTAKHAQQVQRLVGAAAERQEPMRASMQAKSWAGHAVAVVLDLDMDKAHEKAKAKAILAKWIETDVLRLDEWPDKRAGRDVKVVVVGEWITGEEAGSTSA